jgi:hypothetical protein
VAQFESEIIGAAAFQVFDAKAIDPKEKGANRSKSDGST